MSPSASYKPASAASPHTSVSACVQSKAEKVVRVFTDAGVTGKKVTVCTFDPQKYKREEFWLTLLQLNEVENRLRDYLERHENDLVQSLRAKSTILKLS